ncbi:MAG: UDP-N-acetylmuramoyl-L-alanine--D-glutamate ligase [Parcubacteria group bacterium]|nr:UDP-N-acetylmuramoyl-L-alanine--D-glutamate ligase [Parcubacteria group bacterium]
MTPHEYLKDKKVLVMGLGLLGGGIATVKWLVKHGAQVTVTDLKSRADLHSSIKSLGSSVRRVRFVLGKHLVSDFKSHGIVVVNPAVPRESPFLKIARENGAVLENEASLFFRFCRNPIIGVTGTRGKTTTANWIYHFLKQKYPESALAGNSSDNPMLKALDELDGQSPAVVELSSWHLELLPQSGRAPHIAVLTNIYPDHLNRYKNITAYARAKANIFKHQTGKDFLILNRKNLWTKFFLNQKPKSRIKFIPFPISPFLPLFTPLPHFDLGEHNLQNLKTAALAANLAGVSWNLIKKAAKTLPQIKFRQEIILRKGGLTVVNDTTATSPDATIAALKRFSYQGQTLVLITGGTDKKLEFADWAKTVKKTVRPENLFLLESSATAKMINALNRIGYFGKTPPRLYLDFNILLTSAVKRAKILKGKKTLLFSPSAASFEKFKNEFDRGNRFNRFFIKNN